MIYDTIENIKNYPGLGGVTKSLEFLARTDFSQIPVGKYELDGEKAYCMVQEYDTKTDKKVAEAHKKYIDIQYMLEGEEIIAVAPISEPNKLVEEKPEKDVYFYECEMEPLTLKAGTFMVLYPNDLHMPGVAKGESAPCRKVVVKVLVE